MKVTISYKDEFGKETFKVFNNVNRVKYDRAMNAFIFTDDQYASGFNVRDVEVDNVIISKE